MGLLSFIKDAGEKLFSKGNAQATMAQAQTDPASVEKVEGRQRRGRRHYPRLYRQPGTEGYRLDRHL